MSSRDDAIWRSTLMEERIRQRADLALRTWLEEYSGQLDYSSLDTLMISERAWRHVADSDLDPRMVFAHPTLLRENPQLSVYYRGISLLSQKRVSDLATSVASWEDPSKRSRVTERRATEVARLYNTVISSIIEGATDWALENGYRNIMATMGISLDGTFRNVVGADAERAIKDKIVDWLESAALIDSHDGDQGVYELPNDYRMRFSSEPDIEFRRVVEGAEATIATIEIKGGKDPAGALERLGAIQKSFENTPPGCTNMLVAGVITPEMNSRLNDLGILKRFLLDDLRRNTEEWADFLNEVFHHTVRITDAPITEESIGGSEPSEG